MEEDVHDVHDVQLYSILIFSSFVLDPAPNRTSIQYYITMVNAICEILSLVTAGEKHIFVKWRSVVTMFSKHWVNEFMLYYTPEKIYINSDTYHEHLKLS